MSLAGGPCCTLEWRLAISAESFVQKVKDMAAASSGGGGSAGGFGSISVDPPSGPPSEECHVSGMYDPLSTELTKCYLIKAEYFPSGLRMYKEVTTPPSLKVIFEDDLRGEND